MAGKVAGPSTIPSGASGLSVDTGATDNAILRADGTGGATVQNSAVTIDDSGQVTIPSAQRLMWNGRGGFYSDTADVVGLVGSGGSYGGRLTVGTLWENAGGTPLWLADRNYGFRLDGILQLQWTNGSDATGAGKVGIGRKQDGVLLVTDGTYTPGLGAILSGVLVEAHTSGDTLTATESGSHHTNGGASGDIQIALPSAAAGYRFKFSIQAAHYLRIDAASGDVIRLASGDSASAGYIRSNTTASYIELEAVDGTYWQEVAKGGSWSIDS